jgi:YVTN family beta-propeller protein
MAAAHGGQILASQATASLLGDDELEGMTLRDLGQHELKDLDRPERIYQLEIDGLPQDFPPLKTNAPATAADALAEPATPIYRRPLAIGAFAGVLAAAIAIPVFAFGGGSGGNALVQIDGNAVGVVDTATGNIDSEVADVPTPSRITSGADSIWVTSAQDNSVSRIDEASRQLHQTITVGDGPTGIAFGAEKVWVANSLDGTVTRIDPVANDVAGDPIRVGNTPTAIAFGEGAVWVTNVDDRSVSRINPRTLRVEPFDVGAAGRGIAVGAGAIWISDAAQNRVVRIDPHANDITQTIGVGSGPSAVAFAAGTVWVANTLDGTVSGIDSDTNAVRTTVPVGASPGAVAANDQGVWVANESGRTVVRLDPKSGQITQTLHTGARPTSLTLAGRLWIAAQTSGAVHRGGRLVADLIGPGAKTLNPPSVYDGAGWSILSTTNDGLVGFKRAGGSEGTELVPDLATSIPTPTDGGTTYTFQLRKGIHYSTGQVVKASDVRASFERLFRSHPARPDYYTGVVGGAACAKQPASCDLKRGIVADDATGRVTFHLAKPDAEFLYKLALPFAYVLPAGTSTHADTQLPATGPYMLAAHTDKRARLVRNPRFRSWSESAKPGGYPDEIEIFFNRPVERLPADIARGRTDLFTAEPGAPVTDFVNQHPAQVHTTPGLGTFYLFLDTSRAPFNNGDARKAVAYALDRGTLVNGFGGEEAAQTTCQVLPPNLGGYRPYCPYSLNPGTTWSAPDLQRARALVRSSGTAGARVAFWFYAPPQAAPEQRRIIETMLETLGYRPSVKVFTSPLKFFPALTEAKSGPEAGFNGWVADYPAPSNFFEILSCSRLGDRAANSSRYCSKDFDRELTRAQALQSRDQAAATRLWTQIDREATDTAAIVPMFTPRNVDLVSKRVGNYEHHPLFGVLLDQLWVR